MAKTHSHGGVKTRDQPCEDERSGGEQSEEDEASGRECGTERVVGVKRMRAPNTGEEGKSESHLKEGGAKKARLQRKTDGKDREVKEREVKRMKGKDKDAMSNEPVTDILQMSTEIITFVRVRVLHCRGEACALKGQIMFDCVPCFKCAKQTEGSLKAHPHFCFPCYKTHLDIAHSAANEENRTPRTVSTL